MRENGVTIIAEAGINHNGDIELAKKLIDVAAEAGADYVKFQTFKASKLVSAKAIKADYQKLNMGENDDSQINMLRRLELDEVTHQVLIKHAKLKKINFLSTPFDFESVEMLTKLGLAIFKVPSGEITNYPLIKKIGQQNKPVILSTGMSTLGEIERALEVLLNTGLQREQITILHCNTEYPTPLEDVNLRAMKTIANAFKINVGYSDHTLGVEIPIAAAALGATVIEKHFTLDRNMKGPDHLASLEPEELKRMVNSIRKISLALGDGIKAPSSSEKKNIPIARKSIHLVSDLKKGHLLKEEDLIMKRPGDGLSPMLINEVLNTKLTKDLPFEHKLNWTDLEK